MTLRKSAEPLRRSVPKWLKTAILALRKFAEVCGTGILKPAENLAEVCGSLAELSPPLNPPAHVRARMRARARSNYRAKMEKIGWKIATAATAGSGMKRRILMSLVETAGYDLRSSSWGNSISQRENATALTSPRWVSGRTLARTIGVASSSNDNRPSIKGWVAMVK